MWFYVGALSNKLYFQYLPLPHGYVNTLQMIKKVMIDELIRILHRMAWNAVFVDKVHVARVVLALYIFYVLYLKLS